MVGSVTSSAKTAGPFVGAIALHAQPQDYAHHVAEVRAIGDRDVFPRVDEGPPAVFQARAQHVKVAAQEDDLGAPASDIGGLLDGGLDGT